jgi:predicted O-linked N-acetylglucosamine transferase (SPINDLY family)
MEGDADRVAELSRAGTIALQAGDLERAITLMTQAVEAAPQDPALRFNLANVLRSVGRHVQALDQYDRVLALKPDSAGVWFNRGNALRDLGRDAEAVDSYGRVAALRPDFTAAHYNCGNALVALGRPLEAVASFDRAIDLAGDHAEAHANRGAALSALRRFEAAVGSFERAIEIAPDHAAAHLGRGNALLELRRDGAAIASYQTAVELDPDLAAAHAALGNALARARQYAAAIASYDRALHLAPDLRDVQGQRLFAKMQACDWSDYATEGAEAAASLRLGILPAHPFCLLARLDVPALQREAARLWVRRECPPDPPDPALRSIPTPTPGAKIRVGYFSPDFRNHPVSRLTAELFEIHDRSRFDVQAFSFGPRQRDELRNRLEHAFDRFHDVRDVPDEEVVALARGLRLDIAVDLGGLTEGCRPAVFARRPAPVQVSYIGYLGSMGASFMDYLVADHCIVPVEDQDDYTEKIIRLPSYQVNDSQRTVSARVFSRTELGLPQDAFVFCCFNASYKFNPPTFERWMRILGRTPGSVLFLHADAPTVADNLRREAGIRGIDPQRLVFAGPLPFADYLARYRAADLFLDTLPYNAGATASDALWAGLPVLTCRGATFAGRVAASLLRAIELEDLVTQNAADYENLAVELATEPGRLEALRGRLADRRLSTLLFDTRRFTRSLEAAYDAIHARRLAGLAPDHLQIADV